MSHLNKCYPNGRTPTTIIIFRGIIKKKKKLLEVVVIYVIISEILIIVSVMCSSLVDVIDKYMRIALT